jgi:hypothetical protein
MEEYNYEIEKLIRENQLMANYIIKLQEQIKDLKSYAVLYNTQRKKAEAKLKELNDSFEPIIDITYEDGNND